MWESSPHPSLVPPCFAMISQRKGEMAKLLVEIRIWPEGLSLELRGLLNTEVDYWFSVSPCVLCLLGLSFKTPLFGGYTLMRLLFDTFFKKWCLHQVTCELATAHAWRESVTKRTVPPFREITGGEAQARGAVRSVRISQEMTLAKNCNC